MLIFEKSPKFALQNLTFKYLVVVEPNKCKKLVL